MAPHPVWAVPDDEKRMISMDIMPITQMILPSIRPVATRVQQIDAPGGDARAQPRDFGTLERVVETETVRSMLSPRGQKVDILV